MIRQKRRGNPKVICRNPKASKLFAVMRAEHASLREVLPPHYEKRRFPLSVSGICPFVPRLNFSPPIVLISSIIKSLRTSGRPPQGVKSHYESNECD